VQRGCPNAEILDSVSMVSFELVLLDRDSRNDSPARLVRLRYGPSATEGRREDSPLELPLSSKVAVLVLRRTLVTVTMVES